MNTVQEIKDHETLCNPPHAVQCYIGEMLVELSHMAQSSGLRELASLLKATHAAATIDIRTED